MEYLKFLKELHDKFIDLSKTISFDKKHPRQLFMVALYGTILELCGGFITLINDKFYTCIPSIFRSIVEAHVELKNLYSEAEYGYFMEASRNDQWIKVLKEAKKGNNPYLADIQKWDQLDIEIKKHKSALKDLKDKEYKPLKVFERFKRANMENEYRSLYNFLSCDAHSNIRALISRHVDIDINNKDFEVVFYKDKPLEHHLSYLDTTAGIMVDSSGMMHEIFKTGKDGIVKAYGESLSELRKRVLST
jgi:hypothetical protein